MSFGSFTVDWSNADADALFVSWKVYRQNVSTGSTWTLLTEIRDQNQRVYQDFNVTAGSAYAYSVTQTATRSGVLLESSVGYRRDALGNEIPETRIVTADVDAYHLIHPTDPTKSVQLVGVISDSSTLQFETASYTIIGRGRHRDYGDELGYSGTITCQVRAVERPSTFRLRMEALRRENVTYTLRTPFGRLFPVALGDLGWEPLAGVGTSEMGDLTIPYEQVA